MPASLRHIGVRCAVWTIATACSVVVAGSVAIPAQDDRAAGLEVLQLRPNFYMIAGAGANIAAQIGPNGVMLVNAGTADAADAVVAAVARLARPDQPIRYVIDTSADPDVLGGNGRIAGAGRNITSFATRAPARQTFFGTSADNARVLSHESVLTRVRTSPIPSDAWPTETFHEKRRALYFNDEGVEIIHLPNAHTDSDAIVFFRKSDVIVAGNIIDTDRFPMIDVARGGSVAGEIAALNRIIELAIPSGPFVGLPNGPNATDVQQGGTDVIPGHGHVYRQIDVVNYRDMVVIMRDIIQDMIDRRMTLAQIRAADPAKPYKTLYGSTSGPWTTDMFVEAVYRSLTGATSAAAN